MIMKAKHRPPKIHKQSKYFTVMLIPDSSSKTRSIKIPVMTFYVVTAVIVGVLASVGIFVAATNHFKAKAYETGITLEQTESQFSELQQKSKEITEDLSSKLAKEEMDAEQKLKAQTGTYEGRLKYFEDKAAELQEEIDQLNEVKDAVYNQLSTKSYLPKVEPLAMLKEKPKPVFLSAGSTGGTRQNLDLVSVYSGLDKQVVEEMQAYSKLLNDLEELKPYLVNYPTRLPVWGIVTTEFSTRANPFTGQGSEFHGALDIAVDTGTNVQAAGGGTVTYADWMNGYGYLVTINHGFGIETMYGHNSKLLVEVGQRVERGDVIAESGSTGRSTGPHVHYEVRVNDVPQDPRGFMEGYE